MNTSVNARLVDPRDGVSRRRVLRLGLASATVVASSMLASQVPVVAASPPAVRSSSTLHSASRSDNAVLQWNEAALNAIRTVRPGPTAVARNLAIVHTAMFDAWAAYDPVAVGTRLGDTLRQAAGSSSSAKIQAVSFAALRTLVDQFPTQSATFKTLLTKLGYDPGDDTLDPRTPSGVGNLAAQAVLDYRHGDGSNQLGDLGSMPYGDYTGYQPVNDPDHLKDPNRWQPLLVLDGKGGTTIQHCVTPQWSLVTPFALSTSAQFRPGSPAFDPSQAYRDQAQELLDLSAGLSDQQKVMAEYWADGPAGELIAPPIWSVLAQFVSRRDKHDLDADVKLFFALSNAWHDALIAVWDAKRAYDSVRPISAVHYLFKGQPVRAWGGPGKGTQTITGETWKPYLATPPFPEFVSAHSTVSAAAAEILKLATGSDTFGASFTKPAGTSRIEPKLTPKRDVTLHWETFSQAADEAGMSRRYAGIHFAAADLMGRTMGRLIGAAVWSKAQSYFTGIA